MKSVFLSLVLGLFVLGTIHAAEPVSEVKITTDRALFSYDVKQFTVKAGSKVKLTLSVPAYAIQRPHNLVMVHPGRADDLVRATMLMMGDPDGLTKNYIPEDKSMLVAHTKLLYPGETQTIDFVVPKVTGSYPYHCTFPGSTVIMYGKMVVVE